MDRVPVRSSNVLTVGYDPLSSVLEVEFTQGHVYQYHGVPPHHFERLTSRSGSVGRYLNEYIKPRYRCTRVR